VTSHGYSEDREECLGLLRNKIKETPKSMAIINKIWAKVFDLSKDFIIIVKSIELFICGWLYRIEI
jgi:hypothetical protein